MNTLDLKIDHALEHHGWIDCTLTVNGRPHHLSASGALPPFSQLMYFIRAVASNELPYSFRWDEEGYVAKFEATAIKDSPLLHLNITHYSEKIETWLDADIEQETIVQAFLPPLVDFVQNFNRGWGPPRRIVENIQNAVAKGLPLHTDPHAPRHADFIIYSSYGSGLTEDHVNLQIWLSNDFRLHFSVQDTDPFWLNLVGFLEGIASGNFPAQIDYIDNMRFSLLGAMMPAMEQFESKHRLLATPVDHPEHFRLRHYMTESQSKYEELILDEIIDRQQFTRAFVESFGEFLRSQYLVCEDGLGKVFDLRSLSLDKLV